jgi:hypothetical protein
LNHAEHVLPESVIGKTIGWNYEFNADFSKVTKTRQVESASADRLHEDSLLSQLVAQGKFNDFLDVVRLMMKDITQFNLPANDQVCAQLLKRIIATRLLHL